MRRMFWRKAQKRVYLDYAAATPLLPEVKAAMMPFLDTTYANPSAIHAEGAAAKRAVEDARERIAGAIQVRPEFLTFVSGGTEANNLAIMGTVMKLRADGREFSDMEIVTTKIEHPSVMNTMKSLKRRGVMVKYVGVNNEGLVNLEELTQLLTKKTVLFSVAYANNEIGTVQKLHGIKKVLETAEKKFGSKIIFHVDAAQAPLWLSCQFDSTKADLLALDAGKCNGPKGVGLLVRSRRAEVTSYLFGGGQEDGLRPGTENVAGVVGAAVAIENAQANFKERKEKVSNVRDEGILYILENIPNAVLNGPDGEQRLANNINISIPNIDTEFATVVLDKHGFAVSTKSACSGAGGGESTVVKEISGDPARALSTLRISLSPDTTLSDIKDLTKVLKGHVTKMSALIE